METLTRLVAESLARHGFDRPLDYRRLQWSRWFRCESHHSLLSVPSKPGVFALAETVVDFAPAKSIVDTTDVDTTDHVGTAASDVQPTLSEAKGSAVSDTSNDAALAAERSRSPLPEAESRKPDAPRMLAVSQFFEDDDMAFVLDRMLSYQNPMRARLASGRYFVRYVVIEDASQRRSICAALNQWIVSSAEKVTGIGAHFATSLELAPEGGNSGVPHFSPSLREVGIPTERSVALLPIGAAANAHVETGASPVPRPRSAAAPSTGSAPSHTTTAPQLNSGAATNIHCPSPFPSGF